MRIFLLLLGLASPTTAQTPDLVAFAKTTLNAVQPQSHAKNREYCGYIGLVDGALAATPARKGWRHSCTPKDPIRDMQIIASYHTHAGFDETVDSEVPSVDDMFADEEEGIDGFVATPGGRLWHINTRTMVTQQICGIGCLIKDQSFVPNIFGPIKIKYTIDDLIEREDEG